MPTIALAVSAAANQIVVPGGLTIGSFPAPFALESEDILVTGGAEPFYSVLRAQNGTAAATHAALTDVVTGWGGGGATPTLANVLAQGADANGVAVTGVTTLTADTASAILAGATLSGEAGGTVEAYSATADGPGNAFLVVAASQSGYGGGSVKVYGGQDDAGHGASVDILGGAGITNHSGGRIFLDGGDGLTAGDVAKVAAQIEIEGGTNAVHGRVKLMTNQSRGVAGQALVSDGNSKTLWAGVQVAAEVPSGNPTGLPFAYDTTMTTGGLYIWDGAAWVKVATIL